MPSDLADLFAERHAYFACGLTALVHQEPGTSRDACLGDFTTIMAAHLRSVDKAQAALNPFGPSATLDKVVSTYASAGLALATILVSSTSANSEHRFAAQLNALGVTVQAMCRMEQTVVMPALVALLNNEERLDLVMTMQDVFDRHVGIVGIQGFPPRAPLLPAALSQAKSR